MFSRKITNARMLSGSTAAIKGTGIPISMANYASNTMIRCLKPSDRPFTTILVVSTVHNCGQKNAQNSKQAKIKHSQVYYSTNMVLVLGTASVVSSLGKYLTIPTRPNRNGTASVASSVGKYLSIPTKEGKTGGGQK